MATGPNPTYNPSTGQLTYADGTVVNSKAPVTSNANTAFAQENYIGRLGCCSRVYSYAIPMELIIRAFRTGMNPVDARNDPSIVMTLKGELVDPLPAEFTTTQIMMATQQAVIWKLIPQSPFLRTHAEYMATDAFEEWLASNPPDQPYSREDVPTTNVPAVQDWVRDGADDDDQLARALMAREVENDRDTQRSTLLTFLNDWIDGDTNE